MIVVRYADQRFVGASQAGETRGDDTVVGFGHRSGAERFLAQLRIRMAEFALELHPEKTRLIGFGRRAGRDRAARDGTGGRQAGDV